MHFTPGDPRCLFIASHNQPCTSNFDKLGVEFVLTASESPVGPVGLTIMWFAGKPPPNPVLSSTHSQACPEWPLPRLCFQEKGPTGQPVRPMQGYIGSLRKTKTERGGGKTLPTYITVFMTGRDRAQCKEKPVHPLRCWQKLMHSRTRIWAIPKAAAFVWSCTIVKICRLWHPPAPQSRLNIQWDWYCPNLSQT